MNCPICRGETRVIDSRSATKNRTRRRRECLKCGDRFTSYEMAETDMGRLDQINNRVTDLVRNAARIADLAAAMALRELKPDRELIKAALSGARVLHGLPTPYQAAKHLHVDPTSYRRAERSGRCRRVLLVQVAAGYGLTLDALLDLGRRHLIESRKAVAT